MTPRKYGKYNPDQIRAPLFRSILANYFSNQEKIDNAISRIKEIAFVPEEGKTYKGKVKSIMPYGAFVGIANNVDGLLHISEINWERVENVEDVLKEGDEIEVKLIAIDERSGKLKLSRKALLPRPERKES